MKDWPCQVHASPHGFRVGRFWNQLMRALHGNTSGSGVMPNGNLDYFNLHCSNVTAIHSKLGPIVGKGFGGIHFLVETRADKKAELTTTAELAALNALNDPMDRVDILWGVARAEQHYDTLDHTGIAAVVGPRHRGQLLQLVGGWPQHPAMAQRRSAGGLPPYDSHQAPARDRLR